MVNLSVNVNKIATLRNARGQNTPNLNLVTASIMKFGADSITIHPRPDQRHIKRQDVFSLAKMIDNKVEFNIEGYPSEEFIKMVLEVRPHQVTLVPDKPDALTSLEGWDTVKHKKQLDKYIQLFKEYNIRSSIFIHPDIAMVEGAAILDVDRIELFTGIYANDAITLEKYVQCSHYANERGLGVNAGHDLDLQNLTQFVHSMPFLDEVSIGHALISESLFLGLEKTIHSYNDILK